MANWCTLFLNVVSKDPPECSLPEDLDEREINHWWKAKKWSYANLNRLYVRSVISYRVLKVEPNLVQIREPIDIG